VGYFTRPGGYHLAGPFSHEQALARLAELRRDPDAIRPELHRRGPQGRA
jgi:hypothetical protein